MTPATHGARSQVQEYMRGRTRLGGMGVTHVITFAIHSLTDVDNLL